MSVLLGFVLYAMTAAVAVWGSYVYVWRMVLKAVDKGDRWSQRLQPDDHFVAWICGVVWPIAWPIIIGIEVVGWVSEALAEATKPSWLKHEDMITKRDRTDLRSTE